MYDLKATMLIAAFLIAAFAFAPTDAHAEKVPVCKEYYFGNICEWVERPSPPCKRCGKVKKK